MKKPKFKTGERVHLKRTKDAQVFASDIPKGAYATVMGLYKDDELDHHVYVLKLPEKHPAGLPYFVEFHDSYLRHWFDPGR